MDDNKGTPVRVASNPKEKLQAAAAMAIEIACQFVTNGYVGMDIIATMARQVAEKEESPFDRHSQEWVIPAEERMNKALVLLNQAGQDANLWIANAANLLSMIEGVDKLLPQDSATYTGPKRIS